MIQPSIPLSLRNAGHASRPAGNRDGSELCSHDRGSVLGATRAEYPNRGEAGLSTHLPSDLQFPSCETGHAPGGQPPQPIGAEPWFPAEGGAGASWIRAKPDCPLG